MSAGDQGKNHRVFPVDAVGENVYGKQMSAGVFLREISESVLVWICEQYFWSVSVLELIIAS